MNALTQPHRKADQRLGARSAPYSSTYDQEYPSLGHNPYNENSTPNASVFPCFGITVSHELCRGGWRLSGQSSRRGPCPVSSPPPSSCQIDHPHAHAANAAPDSKHSNLFAGSLSEDLSRHLTSVSNSSAAHNGYAANAALKTNAAAKASNTPPFNILSVAVLRLHAYSLRHQLSIPSEYTYHAIPCRRTFLSPYRMVHLPFPDSLAFSCCVPIQYLT